MSRDSINSITKYNLNSKVQLHLDKLLTPDVSRIVLDYFGIHDIQWTSHKPTGRFLLVIDSTSLTIKCLTQTIQEFLKEIDSNQLVCFICHSFNFKKHLFVIDTNNGRNMDELEFDESGLFLARLPICTLKNFTLSIADQLLGFCDFNQISVTEVSSDFFAKTWINVVGCCGYQENTEFVVGRDVNEQCKESSSFIYISDYWDTNACTDLNPKTCGNICRSSCDFHNHYWHSRCRDVNDQKCMHLKECNCTCSQCDGKHCNNQERGCFDNWTFKDHIPFLKYE